MRRLLHAVGEAAYDFAAALMVVGAVWLLAAHPGKAVADWVAAATITGLRMAWLWWRRPRYRDSLGMSPGTIGLSGLFPQWCEPYPYLSESGPMNDYPRDVRPGAKRVPPGDAVWRSETWRGEGPPSG